MIKIHDLTTNSQTNRLKKIPKDKNVISVEACIMRKIKKKPQQLFVVEFD